MNAGRPGIVADHSLRESERRKYGGRRKGVKYVGTNKLG
jgi:hypothetical protein